MEEKSIFDAFKEDDFSFELFENLIKSKPEIINERGPDRQTPLIYASRHCLDVKYVAFLLGCEGIEVNARDDYKKKKVKNKPNFHYIFDLYRLNILKNYLKM